MLRCLSILLVIFPVLAHAQFTQLPISPDIVRDKCVALYRQGRLDSIKTTVETCGNKYCSADNVKWFYIYTDTIRGDDGYFSIGKRILDPYMDFQGRLIGTWSCFYPTGQRYSAGSYATGAYDICQGGTPGVHGYSFRQNDWCFWYSNGQVMARGKYELLKKRIPQSIAIETIVSPEPTSKWMFYDEAGNRLAATDTLIDKIKRTIAIDR